MLLCSFLSFSYIYFFHIYHVLMNLVPFPACDCTTLSNNVSLVRLLASLLRSKTGLFTRGLLFVNHFLSLGLACYSISCCMAGFVSMYLLALLAGNVTCILPLCSLHSICSVSRKEVKLSVLQWNLFSSSSINLEIQIIRTTNVVPYNAYVCLCNQAR